MLSLFRTGIGNVVVAGVAFLIIVAFAVELRAGSSGPTGKLARECVVAYDGGCVDAKEYYAAHGMIVPRQVEAKASKKYSLNKKVLDGLVERELLVAEARKLCWVCARLRARATRALRAPTTRFGSCRCSAPRASRSITSCTSVRFA